MIEAQSTALEVADRGLRSKFQVCVPSKFQRQLWYGNISSFSTFNSLSTVSYGGRYLCASFGKLFNRFQF